MLRLRPRRPLPPARRRPRPHRIRVAWLLSPGSSDPAGDDHERPRSPPTASSPATNPPLPKSVGPPPSWPPTGPVPSPQPRSTSRAARSSTDLRHPRASTTNARSKLSRSRKPWPSRDASLPTGPRLRVVRPRGSSQAPGTRTALKSRAAASRTSVSAARERTCDQELFPDWSPPRPSRALEG